MLFQYAVVTRRLGKPFQGVASHMRVSPMDLTAAREHLRSREDVVFAYLFGSTATGDSTPLSDVDIAVYVTGGDLFQKRLEGPTNRYPSIATPRTRRP